MKALLTALAAVSLCGCTVVPVAGMRVNLLCNKTIVNQDGLHYTKDEIGHVRCDKKHPLYVSFSW